MRGGFANFVLGVLLAVLIAHILAAGRGVILPMVAGLIVAYVVIGLTDLVGRLPIVGARLPAAARYGVSLAAMAAGLFLFASLVVANVGAIAAAAPGYQDRLAEVLQSAAARFGVEAAPSWETLRDEFLGDVNLQGKMATALASLTGIVGVVSLVAIYAAFALSERQTFARKLGMLSDDPARVERLRAVVADVNARIGTYLVMKTLINVLLGAISYLILRGAGVEFAGFWAILIGIFNYIPYVGSFIGVFFPVALSVLQFGDLGPVIALTLLLAGAQMLVGNVIEPWLMGSSLNLSPFVIMVSLVAWTAIWGIPGAILSVPITAILVIVLSEFEGTRPIAVLLSRDGDLGEDARNR
jgi:predicted PurR-regulated permease PerM